MLVIRAFFQRIPLSVIRLYIKLIFICKMYGDLCVDEDEFTTDILDLTFYFIYIWVI